MTALFATGRPIMGDLLRAALWCACASPKAPASRAVWDAFDKALSKVEAPQIGLRALQQRIRDIATPWIAPVEVSVGEWPLVLRLWRLCQAFGYTDLQIGSADAVGFGYGIQLREFGGDEYFARREPVDGPAVYLGLRPAQLPLADLVKAVEIDLKIEKTGIAVRGHFLGAKQSGQDLELNSWIVDLRRPIPRDLATVCMRTFEYAVAVGERAWWVRAISPESAIRLGGHCAAGCLLAFVPGEFSVGPEAHLVLLRPSDEAPTKLVAERHSRSGSLAAWLQLPVVPIVLELSKQERAALDAEHLEPLKKTRKKT